MIDFTKVKVGDKFRAKSGEIFEATDLFSEEINKEFAPCFKAKEHGGEQIWDFSKKDGRWAGYCRDLDLIEKIEEPPLINPDDIVFGRELVMRNGCKAIVHAKYGDEWFGVAFIASGATPFRWHDEGVVSKNEKHCHDLVGIWQEPIDIDWSKMPAWVNYAAMDVNGKWTGFWNGKPVIHCCNFWVPEKLDGACIDIHPNYAPKWKGDWTKSLVKRPDNAT